MYDLVIISNSLEGRALAQKAVNLKYRVALVELPFKLKLNDNQRVFLEGLSYFAKVKNDFERGGEMGFNWGQDLTLTPDYYQILAYINELKFRYQKDYDLAILNGLGVDIIEENGDFCRLPQLGLITETRKLFAKKYVIATGSYPQLLELEELYSLASVTLNELFEEKKLASLKNNLTIFVEDLIGLELAYSLTILGKEITVICPELNILPWEDQDLSHYIQALLEGKGVKILLNSTITQIKKIDQQIWLQAGDQALEIDDFIYIGKNQPNLANLNLDGVKVKYNDRGIIVDQKLQTTNAQIFAYGGVIGGYNNWQLSQAEADFILDNFRTNSKKINYNYSPYQILNYPSCARIGLTEKQAKNHYRNLIIMEEYNSRILNIKGQETIDYIKIILDKNQKILGVHIADDRAGVLINYFALAMKKKIKYHQLMA